MLHRWSCTSTCQQLIGSTASHPAQPAAETCLINGNTVAQNCRLGGRRRATAGQQACTRMKGPGAQSATSYWHTEQNLIKYSTRCPCAQRTTQSLTTSGPSSKGFKQKSKQLFRYRCYEHGQARQECFHAHNVKQTPLQHAEEPSCYASSTTCGRRMSTTFI